MNESISIHGDPTSALAHFGLPERPRTRADCDGQARPCPWTSCRYHLALDINQGTGSVHLNAGARDRRTLPVSRRLGAEEWLDRAADTLLGMPETCALDVAERGGATLEEIAAWAGHRDHRNRRIVITQIGDGDRRDADADGGGLLGWVGGVLRAAA